MVLPRLDFKPRSRLAFGHDAGTDKLGLPVLLSVAGIIVVFVLAAGTALEQWLDSTTGPMTVETAAVVEDGQGGKLFINLTRQIDELHLKIDEMKADYERVTSENRSMAVRLKELETQLGPYTASIPTAREPVPLAQAVEHAAKRDRLSIHLKLPPETALVKTVPQGARTTQTLFALKLPNFRSMEELSIGWRGIRNRSGKVLLDLEPRTYATHDEGAGTVYRLIAGPIRNAADAATRCARLHEVGVDCEMTLFAGERISSLSPN